MEKALAKIRGLIESNEKITSNLSVYYGEPAFVFQIAPDDMEMPYIVMRVETNNVDDVEFIDRAILNFDIYIGDGDYSKANSIASEIARTIDNLRSPEDGIIIIYRQGDYPVPEDDPSVLHLNCAYLVRLDRTDLYIKGE